MTVAPTMPVPEYSVCENRRKSSKSFFLAAIILAVVTALFFGLYLQNLPYEQEAGVTGWRIASATSWTKMFGYLLTPVSLNSTADNVNLIQTRVTESILHKLIFSLFRDSMIAMAVFNLLVAVFFSLALLWVGKKWTGNVLAAVLISVFLLTTPAYGWSIAEYGDFSPLDQLLLLIYLVFFVKIYESILDGSGRQFTLKRIVELLAVCFVGILTVRSKETGKFLVPGISWLVFFLNPTANFFTLKAEKKLRAALPLCLVLIFLTLPVILVKKGPASGFSLGMEDLKAPFYIFFQNPFTADKESPCVLFSIKHIYPSTILANFGFFLSWLAIGSGLFLLLPRKNLFNTVKKPSVSIPFMLICWTGICLAFHVVYKSFEWTRYLTWSLLPFTFLMAWIYVRTWEFLTRRIVKTAFMITLLVFTAVSITENLGDSFYVRQSLERIWVPKYTFRAEIYKDQVHVQSPGLFEYMSWWYPRTDLTRAVEPYLLPDVSRADIARDQTFQNILGRFGVAYVANEKPLEFPWKSTLIKELKQEDFSFLTRWKLALSKKKKPKRYYLYRIDAAG